jgi:hypothetical protein
MQYIDNNIYNMEEINCENYARGEIKDILDSCLDINTIGQQKVIEFKILNELDQILKDNQTTLDLIQKVPILPKEFPETSDIVLNIKNQLKVTSESLKALNTTLKTILPASGTENMDQSRKLIKILEASHENKNRYTIVLQSSASFELNDLMIACKSGDSLVPILSVRKVSEYSRVKVKVQIPIEILLNGSVRVIRQGNIQVYDPVKIQVLDKNSVLDQYNFFPVTIKEIIEFEEGYSYAIIENNTSITFKCSVFNDTTQKIDEEFILRPDVQASVVTTKKKNEKIGICFKNKCISNILS